jgi:hypothetical protein
MSWLRRLVQSVIKPAEVKSGYSPSVRYALEAMPTVKFDPSTVSPLPEKAREIRHTERE